MSVHRKFLLPCLTAALLGLCGAPARAQSLDADDTVFGFMERGSSVEEGFEKQPLGRSIGSALGFASLQVSELYNDNIYATENAAKSDFLTSYKPSLALKKSFGRHDFALIANGDFRRYLDYDDENTNDYGVGLKGVLEARHDLKIPVEASFKNDHRERTNRAIGGLSREPVGFKEFNVGTGFSYQPNRFGLDVMGRVTTTAFSDGELLSTGAPVINRAGDDRVYQVQTVLSYDTRKLLKPFLSFVYEKTDYIRSNLQAPSPTQDRDNAIMRILAGTEFNYHDIITGRIGAGADRSQFHADAIEPKTDFSSEGNIRWMITRRLSLSSDFGMRTREDNLIQTGFKEKSISFLAGYEALHNLNFGLSTGYKLREGTDSPRTDEFYGLGLDMNYILSPRLSLGGSYRFKGADSTAAGASYDQNVFMLRLTGAL